MEFGDKLYSNSLDELNLSTELIKTVFLGMCRGNTKKCIFDQTEAFDFYGTTLFLQVCYLLIFLLKLWVKNCVILPNYTQTRTKFWSVN